MIVVDANVMVFAYAGLTERAQVAREALRADGDWIAPGHMSIEVIRTLSKAVAGGHLTPTDANTAFDALTSSAIRYIETDRAIMRAVWSMRHNVSAYDAAYLAIARIHDARLVTFDRRLAKAAEQAQPHIAVQVL
jgi:predicted nucleic acid-binding protein